jgi:uncharacterized membrane protein YhaH (DUF805 family)
MLVFLLLYIPLMLFEVTTLLDLLGFSTFIPLISLSVRRLHDIGKSGWWYLLIFIPVLGSLLLLFWAAKKSEDGENRFGSNPLEERGLV